MDNLPRGVFLPDCVPLESIPIPFRIPPGRRSIKSSDPFALSGIRTTSSTTLFLDSSQVQLL